MLQNEFSVIGADILGNVYEQFLGKVIRLTAGHQAKVEEKPQDNNKTIIGTATIFILTFST